LQRSMQPTHSTFGGIITRRPTAHEAMTLSTPQPDYHAAPIFFLPSWNLRCPIRYTGHRMAVY
jgi:hypothetical protein